MKRLALLLAVTVICLYATNAVILAQHKHDETKSMNKADSSHGQSNKKGSVNGTRNTDSKSALRVVDAKALASMEEIVRRYLDLKNALADDKTEEAASAGTALEGAFKKFDKNNLTASQRTIYDEVEDDAREHGEHIGANAGNIAHQREHFDM